MNLVDDGRGLTDGELEGLRRFIEEKGLGAASVALEVSKETIARALARLPIARESVAVLRRRFEKVGIHVGERTGESTK